MTDVICMTFLGLSIDFLFPFGESVGDSILQSNDDGVANVLLTAIFPYFDHAESDVYVSQCITLLNIHA